MIDIRIMNQMSEMNDEEWDQWHLARGQMVAFAKARLECGDLDSSDPKFLEVFNEALGEYWDQNNLPEDLWPGFVDYD